MRKVTKSYIWITPDGKRTKVDYEFEGEATPYLMYGKKKAENRAKRRGKFAFGKNQLKN